MKKRVLSFLLVLVMMVTMIPALDLHASAAITVITDRNDVSGRDYTTNAALARKLDAIFDGNANIYANSACTNLVDAKLGTSNMKNNGIGMFVGPYNGPAIKKGTSCWIYANGVYYTLFGECTTQKNPGKNSVSLDLSSTSSKKVTYENCKAWGVRQGVGALIRTSSHSVIVLHYDKDSLTVLDGNGDGNGLVAIRKRSWDKVKYVASYINQPKNDYYNSLYPNCYHKYTDLGVCTSTCKKPFDFMGTKDNLVAGTYKITLKGGVYPRTDRPYGASTNKADLIPEGAEVTVEYGVKNHYGNRWFFVAYKGIKGYVSADNMILVAHDCNHGKFKWKWTAHPHYNCYECSLCGEIVADTNEPTYNKSCQTCADNHVHDKGQFKWSWTDHPHYNCYECKVCGEIVADTSEPTYKSSCGTCTETHKHDHGKFKWKWTDHPHYNCYECSGCGEIVADTNEPTFRADCQTCLESHEHDHGKFKWKWTAHPHYNCYECSLCGEIVADTNEPTFRADCENCTNTEKPCQHRYDFTITQEPALTQGGTYTAACITCGEFTNCNLPMLNTKDYAYTRTAEASCENNGREEYRWTDDFGADFLFEVYSPATGHSAELQNTKTAACTTDGYTGDEVCTLCGKTLKQGEIIKAAGHKWDDGKVIKQPTETNEGIQRFTCSVCMETEDTSIPVIDHKHSFTETVIEPTCTENGYTLHECFCGESYRDNYIDAVDHDTVLKNAKPPKCTTDGYTGDEVCALCGKTLKQGEIIKAAGHKWDDGKVIKQPTETNEGIQRFTCSVCMETEDTSIPVIDHKHSFTETVIEPTCTENGYTLHECFCGESYRDNYIDAVDHDTVLKNAKPPRCTTDGYTGDEVCALCGKTVKSGEVIKAKGHSFSNGKCTICGAADPNHKDPTPPAEEFQNPFTDVKNGDWFYAPVLWAVENGVTGGTSPNTFSPNAFCTRAQVVTFLWAANGKPAPTSMNNPFTDVSDSAWYCKAVMWAVEQGITGGTSPTTFSPDAYCTRAQVATFLYAAQGKPLVKNTSNEFIDVPNNAWYLNPVLWAAENGITGGIGGGKFGPDQTCTRAQIATFLYKAMS